jgi:hypothetical protein
MKGAGFYEHQGFMYGFGGKTIDLGNAYVVRDFSDMYVSHDIKNKILVAQVNQTTDGKPSAYVIVPGYVQSTGIKQADIPVRVTNVVPITNKREKEKLKDLIEPITQGPINFW